MQRLYIIYSVKIHRLLVLLKFNFVHKIVCYYSPCGENLKINHNKIMIMQKLLPDL